MKDDFKILIVEDESIFAKNLAIILDKWGFVALKPVAKGEDAVKVAYQEKPSLILMDILLAGELDGIETAEKISQQEDIPILFMTGYSIDNIEERTININSIGYLEKPINLNELKQILNRLRDK